MARCRRDQGRGSTRRRVVRRQAGFTLLEILVVIAILGLLLGLAAPAVMRQLGGARETVARQSIERIGAVLDLYRLDVGSYPTTEQGLRALIERPQGVPRWSGPYLRGDAVPLDPWNQPFVYRFPATRRGKDYDLCSRGPAERAAQQGEQAMICN